MMTQLPKLSILALAVSAASSHALEALDDGYMSGVSGQSGLTIDYTPEQLRIGALDYTQDGVTARMADFEMTSTDASHMTIDVANDGTLNLRSELGAHEFSVGSFGMIGSTGNSGEFFSMRGRTLAYDPSDNTGLFQLNIGEDADGAYVLDGSQLGVFFDRLHFSDDGLEWILDDLVMSAVVNYGRLIVNNDGLEFNFGDANNRGLTLKYEAQAIGMSLDPSNPLGYDDDLGNTFGALSIDLDAYGSIKLNGGGATGQGVTFIPSLTLINDDDSRPAFKYTDDGFIMLARNFTGTYSSESGFTIDFEEDGAQNPYLAIRFQDFDLSFSLEDFVLGGTQAEYDAGLLKSMGSFKGQALFRDGFVEKMVDGTAQQVYQQNYMKFYPGGAVGTQGITADVSWNIVSGDLRPVDENNDGTVDYNMPALESTYIAMQDDGNWVYFNGLNSWGEGTVTLDMTRQTSTVGLYDNPYNTVTGEFDSDLGYTGNYDGLRIGFENLRGKYSFAGVTVGNSEQEARDSALMGGTELLLALEVFPAYEFTLNGNLTIGAGGQIGSQGLTLNGDLRVTNGNAGLTIDEYGKGVWLTDVTYDMHMRDASIDVTEDGLTFNKGLTWSTIKVGAIRFGSSTDGENLGTFTLERLEDGTTISVASGGAGQVCIGGTLNAGGNGCAGEGVYIDRGDQGLTIKVKAIFAEDDGSDIRYAGKGNRFSWTQPNGTTIALENFSTSDGPGSEVNGRQSNDYGLNVDIAVDVAPTIIRDQDGNLVQDDALGFAVFGRVHFKQLNIDGLSLAATPTSAPQTLIQGIVVQNADIQANLTATPIR